MQAVSQHTLSTQKVDAHCSAVAQLVPLGCGGSSGWRRRGRRGVGSGLAVLVGVGVAVGVAVESRSESRVGVLVGVAVGMGVGVGVGVGVGAERHRGLILDRSRSFGIGSHRSPLPLPQNRPGVVARDAGELATGARHAFLTRAEGIACSRVGHDLADLLRRSTPRTLSLRSKRSSSPAPGHP